MKNETNIHRNFRKILGKSLFLAVCLLFIAIACLYTASAEANYCCEKTTSGAWCQNAPQSSCDSAYKIAPTSCESTSYCKPGCCFDSIEGLCMESTPQRICSANNGTWANDSKCAVAQCSLGCCIIGDQGAFVTLTRCKQLSGFYQLETDFRRNIQDEVTCIATAQAEDVGACVYANPELLRNECTFTTRSNCRGAVLVSGNETNASLLATGTRAFYKDTLCSAEELGTLCGPSTETTLVDGKDEVYFKDSCGNVANIYDASRYTDKQYWKKVFKKQDSCGYGSSNANSRTCGNCDYYLGSIGKKATGALGIGQPTYGNYICIDLSCKKEGKKHGESWCATDAPTGNGQDTAGSRYFKEICLNGEVLTEPCADYRNEVCIQGSFGGFSEAACRVNRWQSCLQQVEQGDCENIDARDCKWISGYYYSTNSNQLEKSTNDSTTYGRNNPTPKGVCVPNYPPGFAFWGAGSSTTGGATTTTTTTPFNATTPAFQATTPAFGTGYVNPTTAGTSASTMCGLGNAKLTVKFTKTVYPLSWDPEKRKGVWECDADYGNCQYLTAEDEKNANISTASAKNWASDMNSICYQLGDCGGYINWLGKYTEEGYAAYSNSRRVAGSGGSEILEKTKSANSTTTGTAATGGVVQDLIKSEAEGA